MKIAIDGPAGAGKSTISKELAKRLNFVYIDTGAMYRAVGLKALRLGIDVRDAAAVSAMMCDVDINIAYVDGAQRIFLDGEDVSDKIRTPEVSLAASEVAVIPDVRRKLMRLQQALAERADVVMDGRDIGTFVLPDADVKIFLTADAEERARRRYNELVEKGEDCDYAAVLEDMRYRDANDSSRILAPLKAAPDARVVDTTGYELQDSIELMVKIVIEQLDAPRL